MNKVIVKHRIGDCHEKGSKHSVDEHFEIEVTFTHSQLLKFIKVTCPNESSCKFLHEHSYCPLLEQIKLEYNPNAHDNKR